MSLLHFLRSDGRIFILFIYFSILRLPLHFDWNATILIVKYIAMQLSSMKVT